jgi:hypothetical protein
MSGFVTGAPRALLRLEGFLVLVAATFSYAGQDTSWWLFAALFLAPDLSMLGYLAGPKVGAAIYNTAHFYGLPLALIACGVFVSVPNAVAIGLVWAAHIGLDRALGYGLKYGEGFGASHLGRIGATKKAG